VAAIRKLPDWTCPPLRRARRLTAGAIKAQRTGSTAAAEYRANKAASLLAEDPHDHPADVVAVRQVLATALAAQCRYDDAVITLRQAAMTAGADASMRRHLVDVWILLGNVHRLQGRYPQAEDVLLRAQALSREADMEAWRQVAADNAMGILCKDTGRYGEAEHLYQRAATTNTDTTFRATLLHNFAGLAHARGDYAAAEPPARSALRLRTAALGQEHPDVAADIAVLGSVLHGQGRMKEAEEQFMRALTIYERRYGPDHYEAGVNHGSLGALYTDMGHFDAAERQYGEALRIKERVLGPDHPELAVLANNLAVLYARQGRHETAQIHYRRAVRMFQESLGRDHPTTVACRLNATRGERPTE